MSAHQPSHLLVVGAAGAIGAALARALRARFGEARLSLADRDEQGVGALAQELGGEPYTVDLARPGAAASLFEAVSERSIVDGLVNAAGIMEVRKLETLPWARAEELMQIDLMAPLLLMHATAGAMVESQRPGFIVNITSMAGRVPLKGCAFYGAAKAGLSMASEIARAELAPHGISVVTVYPGPISSALERGARAQYEPATLPGLLPLGDPAVLATRILAAIERSAGARVIYPALYGLGYSGSAIERFTLGFGPAPVG